MNLSEEVNTSGNPVQSEFSEEVNTESAPKKRRRRIGVRLAVSIALIAAMAIMHFCGLRANLGERISSGVNTIGVVKYIVGKYNALTSK